MTSLFSLKTCTPATRLCRVVSEGNKNILLLEKQEVKGYFLSIPQSEIRSLLRVLLRQEWSLFVFYTETGRKVCKSC